MCYPRYFVLQDGTNVRTDYLPIEKVILPEGVTDFIPTKQAAYDILFKNSRGHCFLYWDGKYWCGMTGCVMEGYWTPEDDTLTDAERASRKIFIPTRRRYPDSYHKQLKEAEPIITFKTLFYITYPYDHKEEGSEIVGGDMICCRIPGEPYAEVYFCSTGGRYKYSSYCEQYTNIEEAKKELERRKTVVPED
jgi:hypothetical protein